MHTRSCTAYVSLQTKLRKVQLPCLECSTKCGQLLVELRAVGQSLWTRGIQDKGARVRGSNTLGLMTARLSKFTVHSKSMDMDSSSLHARMQECMVLPGHTRKSSAASMDT